MLLEVLLTLWAQFSEIAGGCQGACSLGCWRRCGFGCCLVQVLVTIREGRVLGDVSGAGAGAALGCSWGRCFRVLVLLRAHMDGGVLGRVLFGVSWLSHHHDAGRSIMMLNFITLSQDDSWLWYDQDAALPSP